MELVDQLHQHADGARSRDVITCDDRGSLGRRDELGHDVDPHGIGSARGKQRRRSARRDLRLLLHDIDWQRHEHRTGRRLVGDLEGIEARRNSAIDRGVEQNFLDLVHRYAVIDGAARVQLDFR